MLWVIGPRPLEQDIVSAAGLAYARLNVGGIHGMAPWHAAPNLLRLSVAVPCAAALLRRFRPDVVVLATLDATDGPLEKHLDRLTHAVQRLLARPAGGGAA